ncbi:hypothetical protein A5647_12550 [Mycobacterium sp. 1100029.7]|nr:hypothetical protein A5647_12550 [Mycobacterium sp. 1100029.7]
MDSPDHDDAETTSYKTPFGQMMDSRNAHLDALPGKVYRDWFEQLNRASNVFGGNSVELEKHFTQFVGTQMFVNELRDDFGTEAARLLHNYLAALATLRDVMRGRLACFALGCRTPYREPVMKAGAKRSS